MSTNQNFQKAAEDLLISVERQSRGEISEHQLLREWVRFRRLADAYFKTLEKQIRIN